MTATLQGRGLAAERGQRVLFRGLELTLDPGRIVWLRGRNGRGKTTLLRLLAGLSTPVEGEVRLDGRPLDATARQQLLYLGHQNALAGDLRVSEALRFIAALHGRPDEPGVIAAALARLGLAKKRNAFVRTLSQGQRRRAALARLALPEPPPVWLLDEPFDALDSDGTVALQALIDEHAARGGCALITSHIVPPATRHDVFDLDPFAPAGV
jgi:heme exporter protein A